VVSAVDGAAYVAGWWENGLVDFDPGPGTDEHDPGYADNGYLSKFNTKGDFQWVRNWGDAEDPFSQMLYVNSLDANNSGDIVVIGSFKGHEVNFAPGPGLNKHSSNGDWDIFLSKFDSGGNFHWAKTWGAAAQNLDYGLGVAVEESGISYATGWFCGACDFDPGSGEDWHDTGYWGYLRDAFLSKFDSAGNFLWARTWGGDGSSVDEGHGVTTNNLGDVFVTGFSYEWCDFDPGAAEDWHHSNGYGDVFLSKFDANGDFQWAETWGGGEFDQSYGIAVDYSNNIFVTGDFGGTVDFDPGSDVDAHTSNGSYDVFLSKFLPDGTW